MLVVALVQFAKGGYLLAYLPAAVIALLLPLGALNRRTVRWRRGPHRHGWRSPRSPSSSSSPSGPNGSSRVTGCCPEHFVSSSGALWLEQPRYQAPYADTRQTIRDADATDIALRDLGPSVDSDRDVVVFDTVDGGQNIYRNAGWALPGDRIALIQPGGLLYNQLQGALYYSSGASVEVGPLGVGPPGRLPRAARAGRPDRRGAALPVATPPTIGGYRVWRILPGLRRSSASGWWPPPVPGRSVPGSDLWSAATTDSTKAAYRSMTRGHRNHRST